MEWIEEKDRKKKQKRNGLVAARFLRRSASRRELRWPALSALCVDGFGGWSLKLSTIRLHSSDDSRRPSVATYTSGPVKTADKLCTCHQQQTHSSLRRHVRSSEPRHTVKLPLLPFNALWDIQPIFADHPTATAQNT